VLSIIIVTRNTKELLSGLLLSIRQDASLRPLLREIILVDNASTDGTEEVVRDSFPEARFVKNSENRGFAAAINQASAMASGNVLLLLNSDTRLLPGHVEKLVSFMKDNPSAGIVGPQLVYEDMRPQRSFANVPSLLHEVVPLFLLKVLFPRKYDARDKTGLPRDVESLIGAAILVRAALLRALGGLDERFFFFLEETDFCVRARQKGYRVVLFPSANVIHLQGKTVGQTWVEGRIEYAISLYRFLRKYHSEIYCKVFAAIRVVKSLLFLLVTTLLPFLLLGESMRRKYGYYARLLLWYVKGRPDDAGLRSSSLK
jgi:hypothetical protein